MHIIGVTIGVGSEWKAIAHAAAERMQEMTGVPCFVVSEEIHTVVHPSWIKCHLIDHFPGADSFLVFDADVICLKHWYPLQMFEKLGRPFCAVVDVRDQYVFDECNSLGIAFPDIYVNGGLLIFGREHRSIWQETWKHHPQCGRWLEQGALNLSLLHSAVEVLRLPRWFNVLTDKGNLSDVVWEKAVNLHVCGKRTMQHVIEMQKKYGLQTSVPVEA